MLYQDIVITVTFKMLSTFLLKITVKTLYNNQILSFKQHLLEKIYLFDLKWVLIVLFNKNVRNILNVTVMTMP